MLPLLSCLRQCCQRPRSRQPCFQVHPGLLLDFFVQMPLASYGAGQKERRTAMASYSGERVNSNDDNDTVLLLLVLL